LLAQWQKCRIRIERNRADCVLMGVYTSLGFPGAAASHLRGSRVDRINPEVLALSADAVRLVPEFSFLSLFALLQARPEMVYIIFEDPSKRISRPKKAGSSSLLPVAPAHRVIEPTPEQVPRHFPSDLDPNAQCDGDESVSLTDLFTLQGDDDEDGDSGFVSEGSRHESDPSSPRGPGDWCPEDGLSRVRSPLNNVNDQSTSTRKLLPIITIGMTWLD
jgi:hypothetical protein